MSQRKICFITTIHQSIEWFIADAAKYFAEHGYQVHYICNMDEKFIERHKSYAICHHVAMQRGLNPANVIQSIWQLHKIFRRERFDIIEYATPNAALYASIASRLTGSPHRIYGLWGLRYEGFSGMRRVLFRKIEQLCCRLSSHVYIVSKKNMKIAVEDCICPQNKISVIGLGGTIGVDTRIFDIEKKNQYRQEIRRELDISNDDFVFGFIGRINKDKGVNELIQSFKALLTQYPKIRLVLVGMNDDINPIDAENLHFAETCQKITMTGPISQSLVCRYLSAFDVLVHPTYREGFGKILQEGMAMQLPIITTNIPGPSEVIEENISGLLIPKADVSKLIEAMVYIYANPKHAEALAQAGRKRLVENFTMQKMVKNIFDEFERTYKEKNKI